ncbi:MAG: NifB/NifX family molybdenum-iron cluster-binding protein [Eubacteriales bacterium]|nr:NifB/NifX family molybdenum-iron cluster-binding protein [Eubacteriales bacterium]MDD4389858.1 NifB/NifX family molybdenum-iron cluster-binding protein [Eubacteriales bacterium]
MKIAVPYENGEIFQHFGKSKSFKIYETRSIYVLQTEMLKNADMTHDSIAEFFKEKGVNVIICGGIGEAAILALNNAGLQVLTGAQGDADEIVKACLKNEVKLSTTSNRPNGCSCKGDCHH